MRLVILIVSFVWLTGCGTTLKRADCEEKVYLGCPVGKLECGKDARGCKQCQCKI